KEAVFPFNKFPGVDPALGPEMKSTGEVMGVGKTFAEAFAKAQLGASVVLPKKGKAFLSVKETDKTGIVNVAKSLKELGFELVATSGTAKVIEAAGIEVQLVNKVLEGRPHIVDMIKNEEINLIVNTTEGSQAIADSATIRSNALQYKVTYTTTLAGGEALCMALQQKDLSEVTRLQDFY
ncbi:MAG: carbamoyl phosphate synthase large subunit, partial [Gammaproteobacteria bacterium]|nr:carbamoyl phosphate synthase large subunit [Gammaproteobacteria bacterium]